VPLKLTRKFTSNGEGTRRWKDMGRTESKTRGADGGRVPVVGRQRSRRLRIIGEHEWTHGLKNHWKLGSFTKKKPKKLVPF
jgi:hypothetical protein